MNLKTFLTLLAESPQSVNFDDTIRLIDSLYLHTPVGFQNGDLINGAGENTGSSKILSFALLQHLDIGSTLACFGEYYREVLASPDAGSHPNIRQFMIHGWDGVKFERPTLEALNFSSTTIGFGL